MSTPNPYSRRALEVALNFEPEDIYENEDGRMSDDQAKRLRGLRWRVLWPTIVGTLFSIVLMLVYIVGTGADPTNLDDIVGTVFIWLLALLVLAGIYRLMNLWPHIGVDAKQRESAYAEGLAFKDTSRRARFGNRLYTLRIGEETLRVDREGWLAFRHLEPYVAYYAPRSRIMIAAEPLRLRAEPESEAEQPTH